MVDCYLQVDAHIRTECNEFDEVTFFFKGACSLEGEPFIPYEIIISEKSLIKMAGVNRCASNKTG